MARTATKNRDGMRRCVATQRRRPRQELIRFVIGPDGALAPDFGERLPGRGYWVSADSVCLEVAQRGRAFQSAARQQLSIPCDLEARVESGLAKRCGSLLGLARRSGTLAAGYENAREWLQEDRGAVLVQALDGARNSRRALTGLARGLPILSVLTAAEMGAAIGRDFTVHAVLGPGRLAERFALEAGRLAGFRSRTADGRQG
ncbi:MAG: DUF448 domain-containing protein [Alphaproteobacteria bacterium]|nr:DUF448 domain-containing protein [Alphaproteobacteria bacterium]